MGNPFANRGKATKKPSAWKWRSTIFTSEKFPLLLSLEDDWGNDPIRDKIVLNLACSHARIIWAKLALRIPKFGEVLVYDSFLTPLAKQLALLGWTGRMLKPEFGFTAYRKMTTQEPPADWIYPFRAPSCELRTARHSETISDKTGQEFFDGAAAADKSCPKQPTS